MGLFSGIGSLFDSSPSKQYKKSRNETLAALYGPGTTMDDIPVPGLRFASASNPFASATYGPQGATSRFSPAIQSLFGQATARASDMNRTLGSYFGENFLTEGPLFDALNQSRLGRIQAGENAAANALGKLWNLGGASTGTGFDAAQIQNQLAAASAQEDYNVISRLLGLRGDALDQVGTSLDQVGAFRQFLAGPEAAALGLSGDLTNIDLQKVNRALGANEAYRMQKAGEPGLGATLGGIADTGLSAYAAGGGSFSGLGSLAPYVQSMYQPRSNTLEDFMTILRGSSQSAPTPTARSLQAMFPAQPSPLGPLNLGSLNFQNTLVK